MDATRKVLFSDEFEEYYSTLNEIVRNKYDYALQIITTQYVVSQKFVKQIKSTKFYELRITISSDEHRTLFVAVDHDNFIECKTILLLNSFLKKRNKTI